MMQRIFFYLLIFIGTTYAMENANITNQQVAVVLQSPLSITQKNLGKNFVEVIHSSISARQKQSIAQLLLKLNADPNYIHDGYPLAHRCFWETNTLGVIKLLIEYKGDFSLLDREEKSVFHYALNHRSATDATRVIRAHYAIGLFGSDHLEAPVQEVLNPVQPAKQQISILVPSERQLYLNSCIADVIQSPRSFEIKKKVIEYVIEKGARVNDLYMGLTPLQHALRYGGQDADNLVKLLLELNADPSIGDGLHKTSFFYAISSSVATDENCVDRVKMLFEKGKIAEKIKPTLL